MLAMLFGIEGAEVLAFVEDEEGPAFGIPDRDADERDDVSDLRWVQSRQVARSPRISHPPLPVLPTC